MVNGGYLVTPHLSLEVGAELPEPARVLEPKVARQIREILEYVTAGVPHYARGTLIAGYRVGGKTGTAQIWDTVEQKYKEERFNFSFVGFVGRDDPEVVIAVRLADTRPKIRGQGELELKVTSFELFRTIAKVAIRELEIPRSKDPRVGYPIPGSEADRVLTERRFQPRALRGRDGGVGTADGGEMRADGARADAQGERPADDRKGDARRAAGGARADRDPGSHTTSDAPTR
jgi:membrane peptidoglycan carboxypeptidase